MPYNIILGRDDADKKRFGDKGLIFLGKNYVKMGQYTSLSNPIFMDVSRSHVILVSGKRGSGKCLHGDTLITLANGSQIPIKYLENNGEKILSLNNKLKIEEGEKQGFYEREVEKLLRLRLRSGKEIKLTPEHPLFTIKGWIPAQELRIGSRIATPRQACFGNEEMPEHKIKLLAYLLAEGHLSNGFVLFSNFDEKIVKEFNEAIISFDDNLEVKQHSKPGCFRVSQKIKRYTIKKSKRDALGRFTDNNIVYEKSSINKWLRELRLYNRLSVEKFIPQEIMKLKKEQLVVFLNRLFSCDGSIYKHKTQNGDAWQISYSSSSEKLIRQAQSILIRFGIISRLRYKKVRCNEKLFDTFELVINAENVVKFIEEIGFFGKKQDREFEAKQHILSIKRNTNVDTIPKEIWETFKPRNWAEIGRAFNYKYAKAMRESIDYSPSRQKLLKIAEIEQNNPLQLLAKSDIFWDEIVSIEILEGKFKVYDISVPENHNFVANDIIVHNSYTLGTIAEELATLAGEERKNIGSLIFDTMGIFWTMKFKNEKEKELLAEWNEKPKNIPVRVFAPSGYFEDYEKREIPVDERFSIKPKDLSIEDWILTFKLDIINPISIVIERVINRLKEMEIDFEIKNVVEEIEKDERATQQDKNAAISLFEAADSWRIFSKKGEKGTEISDLIVAGKTSVLDLSVYSSVSVFNVRALVIGLICRKLFNERTLSRKKEELEAVRHGVDYLAFKQEREIPLVWLFIDEVHEFLPNEGKTPATDALIQLLREGRQPGLSIVMATQQPGELAKDAITQSDIVISHRVTAQPDIKALNEMMQSYLFDSIKKYIDDLPNLKGSAIILDDNSERIYPIRVRPRFTWHGGEAPTSVKVERRI
jgi:uncharacterized protein